MAKALISCKNCGKEKEVIITAKDSLPKFCSRECSIEYMKGKSHPPKRIWTKKQDDLIRFAYSNFKTSTKALDYLQEQNIFKGYKRITLSKRATKLGIAKNIKTTKKLTKEEIEIIERFIGTKSAKEIARMLRRKGYNRTWRTIQYYCNKRGNSYKLDYYTLEEVREILGFPSRKQMYKWLEDGLLIYGGRDGKKHVIKPIAIAKFIREYPFELIRYKVDLPFIVALLDEFKPHQTKNWSCKKHEFKIHTTESKKLQKPEEH